MDEVGELLRMIANINSGFMYLSTHMHMQPYIHMFNACRHTYTYATHTYTEMEKKWVGAP